ncbi:MAG: ABC transporter ATP-binding protein [Planctomycetia bacterium]|nr:ABC transporter ATP-binding protein [Planctomycetia bacterium]
MLTASLNMTLVSQPTLGRLELRSGDSLLAHWLFTPTVASDIHRLKDTFDGRLHQAPPSEPSTTFGVKPLPKTGGQPPQATAALLRVLSFATPYRWTVLLGVLLALGSTLASLVPPYLTMPLVDNVLIPRQADGAVTARDAFPYLAGLAAAALISWLLGWGRTWTLAWVSERIAGDARIRTYAHMQSLSLDFFAARRTGDLIARISSDTERLNNYLSINLIEFFSNLLLVIFTAVVLLAISPLLAVVTLVPFPLVIWLVASVRGQLQRGFARSRVAWADMTSTLADTIPGIRVVQAFAQESRETSRFTLANRRVLEANDRVNVTWSYFGPLVTLFSEFGLLVIWGSGVWLIFNGSVTVGTLTAFIAYITRFYAKVESMVRMVPATQRAAASAQRICEILDCRPTVADPVNPRPLGRPKGRLDLHNVRFRYGNREVLHGIDLQIEPGEMIGLVGASGSGKSTLANLICRFHDPSSGHIAIDGIDLREVSLASYRQHLGCVLQEPFLFFGTIAENIAYGRPTASPAAIVAAARAAGAHEFILRLPQGYDSRVGERGGRLSGGERQRISIARALLVDPAILILDEATSSVDAETEAVIQRAVDRLVTGRTTIAIAHRLATLRRADRLVVLDQGRVSEIGTHDELLNAKGIYARLYQTQMTDPQPAMNA